MFSSRYKKGFTLAELMIVMAIIAILATTLFVSITTYRARARDVTRVTDLRILRQSLEGYFIANNAYPPTACGYDCLTVDSDSYITSSQSAWSSVPLASNDSFPSSAILSSLLSPISFPEASAAPLGVGALESMLAPYVGNHSLPRDPINNGTYPWVDKKSYVYSYGNVGKLPGQIGYDLTATLENPNNQLTCKQYFARYGYENGPLCDKDDPTSDDVINPGFSGISHSRLYEAGERTGKYDTVSSAGSSNYSWVTGPWVGSLSCGLDTQTRTLSCKRTIDSTTVAFSFCGTVPATTQVVDKGPCPVNGVCNGIFTAYSLSVGTCLAGTPSAISGTGPWMWTCNGINGGTDTVTNSCLANKRVDCIGSWGSCSNGSQTYTISTAAANGGLACSSVNGATQSCGTPAVCNNATQFTCTSGNPVSNVAGSCGGNSTWGCNSIDGGTNTTATACTKANAACINGSCNVTFNSYVSPTATCATGVPTIVSGTGPWTWGCNSPNGGTNTTATACTANKSVNCIGSWGSCSNGSQTYTISTAAANGGLACSSVNGATQSCGTPAVCNNATQFTCTSGNPVSNVAGSCGGNSTWGCNSIDGGTNTTATACTKANAACACSAAGYYSNGGSCYSPLRGPSAYRTAYDNCYAEGAYLANLGSAPSPICSISGGCGPITGVYKIAWWGAADTTRDMYDVRSCDSLGCPQGAGAYSVDTYATNPIPQGMITSGNIGSPTTDVADGTHYYWCEIPAGSTYSWNSGAWSACSLTCGGGTQTRTPTCWRNDGRQVADGNCNIATKPTVSQSCNTQVCTYTFCKGTYTTYSPAVAATYTKDQGDTACVAALGSGYKWASFNEIGQPNADQVFFNNLYINWANAQVTHPASCTTIWGGIKMNFMMLSGGWIWSQGYSSATNIFDPNYSGGSNGSPTVPTYFCSSATPTTIPLMCCK